MPDGPRQSLPIDSVEGIFDFKAQRHVATDSELLFKKKTIRINLTGNQSEQIERWRCNLGVGTVAWQDT